MQYLREASYGSDGSFPIQNAATSSVTFFADIDDDSTIEKVTYSLSNGTFYQAVVNPAGNPPSYTGQPVATSTVATSVVNGTSTPIFLYYDTSGTLMSYPITLANIASVSTTLVIDVDTTRAPVAYTLTNGATLRNVKEQQ
jgi:hypothetical protein